MPGDVHRILRRRRRKTQCTIQEVSARRVLGGVVGYTAFRESQLSLETAKSTFWHIF